MLLVVQGTFFMKLVIFGVMQLFKMERHKNDVIKYMNKMTTKATHPSRNSGAVKGMTMAHKDHLYTPDQVCRAAGCSSTC